MDNGDSKPVAKQVGTNVVVSRSILRNHLLSTKRKGASTKAKPKKDIYKKASTRTERISLGGGNEVVLPLNWKWPYMRYSDGPEYACPHGIGHSTGVHGCDGCCGATSFPGTAGLSF